MTNSESDTSGSTKEGNPATESQERSRRYFLAAAAAVGAGCSTPGDPTETTASTPTDEYDNSTATPAQTATEEPTLQELVDMNLEESIERRREIRRGIPAFSNPELTDYELMRDYANEIDVDIDDEGFPTLNLILDNKIETQMMDYITFFSLENSYAESFGEHTKFKDDAGMEAVVDELSGKYEEILTERPQDGFKITYNQSETPIAIDTDENRFFNETTVQGLEHTLNAFEGKEKSEFDAVQSQEKEYFKIPKDMMVMKARLGSSLQYKNLTGKRDALNASYRGIVGNNLIERVLDYVGEGNWEMYGSTEINPQEKNDQDDFKYFKVYN